MPLMRQARRLRQVASLPAKMIEDIYLFLKCYKIAQIIKKKLIIQMQNNEIITKTPNFRKKIV